MSQSRRYKPFVSAVNEQKSIDAVDVNLISFATPKHKASSAFQPTI